MKLRSILAFLLPAFMVTAAPPEDKVTEANVKVTWKGTYPMITAIMTNNANKAYTFLNTPNFPLYDRPETEKYSLKKQDGKEPIFKGIRVTFDVSRAAQDKNSVIVLSPGVERKVDFDLRKSHDFSKSAAGTYTLSLFPFVWLVDSTGKLEAAQIKPTPTVSVQVSQQAWRESFEPSIINQGTPNTANSTSAMAPAETVHCNAVKTSHIDGAIRSGNVILDQSRTQIKSAQAADFWNGRQPAIWFGPWTAARAAAAKATLDSLSPLNQDYTYDCDCTQGGAYWVAYTATQSNSRRINLCAPFFDRIHTGSESTGGTLINEASHLRSLTGDLTCGPSLTRALAKLDPDQALRNANSYMYYAESQQTQLNLHTQVFEYLWSWVPTLI